MDQDRLNKLLASMDDSIQEVIGQSGSLTPEAREMISAKIIRSVLAALGQDLKEVLDALGDPLDIGRAEFVMSLVTFTRGPTVSALHLPATNPDIDLATVTMMTTLINMLTGGGHDDAIRPFEDLNAHHPDNLHQTYSVLSDTIDLLVPLYEKIGDHLVLTEAEPQEGAKPH